MILPKRWLAFYFVVIGYILLLATPAYPQWSFGGGVEVRDESPDFGFQIRAERQFKTKIERLSYAFKISFGAFLKDDIAFDEVVPEDVEGTSDSYYVNGGVFALFTPTAVPVFPYGGLGVGYETLGFGVDGFEFNKQEFPGFEDDRRSGYVEGLLGFKIPFKNIWPFMEFRFAHVFDEFEQLEEILGVPNGDITANKRLSLGIMVQL